MFDQGGYEYGVGFLYSLLYYGKGTTIYLSKRNKKGGDRHIPDGLYIVMFSGMQEFQNYIPVDAVKEGLTRRILFVYCPKNERWKPPIDENNDDFYPTLDRFAEKAIKHLDYIRTNYQRTLEKNYKFINVIPLNQVQENINNADKAITEKVDSNPSLENISRQSGWEQIYRLAVTYEIANEDICKLENVVALTVPSYLRANEFLNTAWNNMEGMFDSLSEKKEQATSIFGPTERLFQIIKSSMPNGIDTTGIHRKTHWKAEQIEEYLTSLKMEEKIITEKCDTKGRAKVVFKVNAEWNNGS